MPHTLVVHPVLRSLLCVLGVLLLTLTLTACGSDSSYSSAGSQASPLELRVYPALDQDSTELVRAIDRLMTGPAMEGTADQAFFGRVQSLPNGDLAILAADSVHAGLARLIEEQVSQERGASAANLQFWLIRATPSETTSIPERLAPLNVALNDVANQAGPVTFELIEHVRQRSDIHRLPITIAGADIHASVSQKLVGEDRVFADMNLRGLDLGIRINSKLTLTSGETVLLAQTGSAESDALLMFVVRIDLL